jgi:DNA modification methylase
MFETNKIYLGDTLQVLKTFPDECIDCVVTSPPYWALRTYGVNGELGLEPTFQEHITKMCDVFDEVKRVLKKTGTCWVNYGDTYIGSPPGNKFDGQEGKGDGLYSRLIQRNGIQQENAKVIIQKNPDPKLLARLRSREHVKKQSLPDKCLALIPSRFAIEMCNRGWILRQDIIWHKPNVMPSSVKDRFTQDFEHIFFFSKSKKYWFETQYEPTIELYSEKRAKRPETSNYQKNSGQNVGNFTYNKLSPLGRNKRAVWKIPTKPFKEAHFATFPEALVETPIKAGCPPDGIVLDPFMGAGTVGLVAKKLKIKWVGIELNPAYIKMAYDRINSIPEPMF